MTKQELESLRDNLSFNMIEADEEEFSELERELQWIEELIREQEQSNGKETK